MSVSVPIILMPATTPTLNAVLYPREELGIGLPQASTFGPGNSQKLPIFRRDPSYRRDTVQEELRLSRDISLYPLPPPPDRPGILPRKLSFSPY